MTPATAEAIVQYVKSYNVPAKPNVDESEGVIVAWLKAIGWKMDAWGNYLHPSDPKTRYHFKKTQLNKQFKTERGDWANLSYTSSIDAALSLIVSASGLLGDQELVQKYSKTRGKRKVEKQTRADKEEEKKQKEEALLLAWKEYAAQRKGFIERMLLGKTSDAEVLKAREEFLPLQAKWLEAVKAGTAPEDDQEFASADNPPILPILKSGKYSWTETVDGVEYTVLINSVDKNTAEITIGNLESFGIGVSALTHGIRMSDPDAKGDSYIAGKVGYRENEYRAALFLIMSGSKQKGAGTRSLSIWCRLMSGYGIKQWIAEGVGEEGAAFFLALQKKGKLKLVGQNGPNWALECTDAKQNPSLNPAASINARRNPSGRLTVTLDEAQAISQMIGIQWGKVKFDLEEFRRGMEVELEHGLRDQQTNVTNDNLTLTGKIALAHLKEFNDYYYRLDEMESKAKAERGIPKYLRPYADWSEQDFVKDAIKHGYSKAQGQRFAKQYLWALGKLSLTPPEVGWGEFVGYVFKDGGQVGFQFRKGAKIRIYSEGKKQLAEFKNLRALLEGQNKIGWHGALHEVPIGETTPSRGETPKLRVVKNPTRNPVKHERSLGEQRGRAEIIFKELTKAQDPLVVRWNAFVEKYTETDELNKMIRDEEFVRLYNTALLGQTVTEARKRIKAFLDYAGRKGWSGDRPRVVKNPTRETR